ncbi:pirin-like C-terminal cupin domain-containing protein [Deinococcus yunweiensis]|uniref:pirin-like C-terminal cupin domain-containing protein n=1 Tax=Deinococcus yunweiensis TaxID=367282 RepID=UPI00398EC929
MGQVGAVTGTDARQFTVPITLLDVELQAGAAFTHEVPGDHAAALYVARGRVRIGPEGRHVTSRQTAWFAAGDPGTAQSTIEADEPTFIIAYSGRPVREPVAFGGPFLMSTEAENRQAMADFHAGLFGPLPTDPTPTDAATRQRPR